MHENVFSESRSVRISCIRCYESLWVFGLWGVIKLGVKERATRKGTYGAVTITAGCGSAVTCGCEETYRVSNGHTCTHAIM